MQVQTPGAVVSVTLEDLGDTRPVCGVRSPLHGPPLGVGGPTTSEVVDHSLPSFLPQGTEEVSPGTRRVRNDHKSYLNKVLGGPGLRDVVVHVIPP